jgi:thiamine-monophosphate kinase
MPLGEFELIRRYFADCGATRADVPLGIGDDGALLAPPPGEMLVAVVDTLVEGTHFLPGAAAASIGHRALAVNLSDIAAMGARPAWATLALTLPEAEPPWLAEFAGGFGALARRYGVALVGGDTTRGPLSVTVQVLGFVPEAAALRRDGGRPGDLLCVTGTPGDAACGLALERAGGTAATAAQARLLERFRRPTPRLAAGLRLRGLASACIDVSDGLVGDAAKLCESSRCGAEIDVRCLPLSAALRTSCDAAQAQRYALTGGDDYELLFAVPPERLAALESAWPAPVTAGRAGHEEVVEPAWTVIGRLREAAGVAVRDGETVNQVAHSGFDHFGG